jgi:hypothetical protein
LGNLDIGNQILGGNMKLMFIFDKGYDILMERDEEKRERIKKEYEICPATELKRNQYQKSWDEINDYFSDYIERITGYLWSYDNYECVLSPIHTGISNWGTGPTIVRTWKENPCTMRKVTAHELILSHYFEIHKRYFKNSGLKDVQIWALAEIAAFALTSLTPEVKNFWPWDNSGYYTNHNYPDIIGLQNILKESFLQRKNFNEYIEKGIILVKEDSGINNLIQPRHI